VKVALGFKAHSGWAALIVIGSSGNELLVLDRRRVELVHKSWEKQPYHAAEGLALKDAEKLVKQGSEAAYKCAQREMLSSVKSLRKHGHEVFACAVLVPNPMPEWSVAEILAVHFRMHQAEGVLFPDALANAAESCGLDLIRIPEKQLNEVAEKRLGAPMTDLMNKVMKLGKTVGPPWGKDQKNATLAALIGLKQ
jgi:hypothetical protein